MKENRKENCKGTRIFLEIRNCSRFLAPNLTPAHRKYANMKVYKKNSIEKMTTKLNFSFI